MLDKNSKIYVAGHNGLVGSAIWNNLKSRGYTNLVGRSHKELDLTDQYAVKKFFDEERPDAVVLAAAFVGGESGTQARPMKEEWVKNIKAQCDAAGKAFFFKQWGTWGSDGVKRDKHKNGKQLDGKICQAMPEIVNRTHS